MAHILGWKDILRPIRDGFRHMFPAPDTGPSPEDRRKRREEDRSKGFTYFDTFEQLITWSPDQSDPLQRANTPLLARGLNTKSGGEGTSKILLCHDYAGNYHEYESVQGTRLDEEMYFCEYLQYVETFVYFSHKLVCVPPPTWTNTLHRNGTKALGTILLEPQTQETETLLRHSGAGFDFTNILANIAKHYGFDGYLVNLEKPFPRDSWSIDILRSFLEQLREALGPNRDLIWYDALTMSNEVKYQNGLTPANLPFANACGRILTNYCWDESQAEASKHAALQSEFPPDNIYFGIDVWAQNRTKLTHPRTTYPKQDGGGTNTGIAVAKLAELGMSAGIFAPAWSFEHFPHCAKEVEQAMWKGGNLPENTECSCGNATDRHRVKGCPIIANARLHPAGSESFLYTEFLRAFASDGDDVEGMQISHNVYAHLGSQSPLPYPSPTVDQETYCAITHRLETSVHGSARLIIESHCSLSDPDVDHDNDARWLPLYKLDMPADNTLDLAITCRSLMPPGTKSTPSFYVKFNNQEQPQMLGIDAAGGYNVVRAILGASSAPDETSRVQELGFHLTGPIGEGTVPVVEMASILIMPNTAYQTPRTCSIHGMRLQTQVEDENSHTRLCWGFTDNVASKVDGVPYSDLTGPFSHFEININGKRDGRAYALEHVISRTTAEALASKEMDVEITGVGFDGRLLAHQKATLHMNTNRDI